MNPMATEHQFESFQKDLVSNVYGSPGSCAFLAWNPQVVARIDKISIHPPEQSAEIESIEISRSGAVPDRRPGEASSMRFSADVVMPLPSLSPGDSFLVRVKNKGQTAVRLGVRLEGVCCT